jgi:hypothetical protein
MKRVAAKCFTKKWLFTFVAALPMSQPASAATNLILTGGATTQASPVFTGSSVPWQANFIPLAVLMVGLAHLFYPRMGWWLKYGWKFGDSVEPSALWLFFERLGGILIIGAAGLLFCAIHGINLLAAKG